MLTGVGVTGAGIVSCVEMNTIHLCFAFVFFVSGGVLVTNEARYKKSVWMAVSSGMIWLSLIGIAVLAVIGKGRSPLLSIFEWLAAIVLLTVFFYMGR